MPDYDVLSKDERIKEALYTLKELGAGNRGDSFDIGQEQNVSPDVYSLLSNPQRLVTSLGLNKQQAENVASLVTAGSAGAVYKILSNHLGSELAGAVGGFVGGYISRKIFGGR